MEGKKPPSKKCALNTIHTGFWKERNATLKMGNSILIQTKTENFTTFILVLLKRLAIPFKCCKTRSSMSTKLFFPMQVHENIVCTISFTN